MASPPAPRTRPPITTLAVTVPPPSHASQASQPTRQPERHQFSQAIGEPVRPRSWPRRNLDRYQRRPHHSPHKEESLMRGTRENITAARHHVLPPLDPAAAQGLKTPTDKGDHEADLGILHPINGHHLAANTTVHNRLITQLRAPAVSTLLITRHLSLPSGRA